MPADRPEPEVTRDESVADNTSAHPDTTHAATNPSLALGGRPFPFLSPPTHPGDLGQLGPYRVVKLLGEGGMGFVFRGEDDALRRPVALKVMRPEVAAGENARERFLREGRAAAAVKSDHVITIYQVGEANGVPFLAMEFLAGCTLDDWLKGRGGAAPAAAIVKVAKDTLRGLGAAHDRGLIHRDIKPANLWLEAGTGRVKVLDFGLTRGAGADDVLTREGALVGTPAYMAPEQAAGRPVDPRADLFSVGVVLYRMAAGRNPFQRGDVWATLTALAVDVPPPAASAAAALPADLGGLIDRLVAKTPADRPESARAALAAVLEVEKRMKGGGTAAVPVVSVPVVYAPPAAVEANPWAEVAASVTEVEAELPPRERPPAPDAKPAPGRSVVPLAAGVLGLVLVVAVGVGVFLAVRPGPVETAKGDPPPEEKVVRPAPQPKPPEELLVPAAGPVVKAAPSPFDALDAAKIPAAERVAWLPKEAVAVLGGHRGDTRNWTWDSPIEFSPDGKWFAVRTNRPMDYQGINLYDAATLDLRWSRPGGGTLAFSPDGKWLAFGVPQVERGDFEVDLLDLTTPEPRVAKALATADANSTHAIRFLADGKTLLTASGFGGLRAWDYTGATVKLTRTLREPTNPPKRSIGHLQLSADGRRLVDVDGLSGSASFVGVWDVSEEPKELYRVPEVSPTLSLALAPDGGRLVILRGEGTGANHAIDVWRIDGAEPVRESTTPLGGQFTTVGPVTVDGKQVFLGGASAVLMDLAPTGAAKARDLGASVMAARPDLSRFVQAVGNRRFRVLDGGAQTVVEPGEQVCGADAVPVAAGGRVFTFHPTTRAWAVKDGGLIPEPVALADDLGVSRMYGTATSSDGRSVAGVGADHTLRAFSVGPPARITSIIPSAEFGLRGILGRLAWHPDGRRVLGTSPDGAVGLWDMSANPPTSAVVGPMSAPDRAGMLHLAVAPAGDVVAACDPLELGGGVTFRRLDAPKASARVLSGVPDEYALSSQFLPDGRTLLVAFRRDNEPYRVRRYDLSKREPVPALVSERPAPPGTYGEAVHTIQLSRDGARVLGYVNSRVYVVDVATRAELLSADLGELVYAPPSAQVRWADDGRHVLLGQHGCVYVLRVPDAP